MSLPHQSRTASPIWLKFFFKMFVIARRRFLRKKILGKSTGKVENLDVKNTTVARNSVLYIGCYWLIRHVC